MEDHFVSMILMLAVLETFWITARCDGIPDYSGDYYFEEIASEAEAIWSLRSQNDMTEGKPERCLLGYGKGPDICRLRYGNVPMYKMHSLSTPSG